MCSAYVSLCPRERPVSKRAERCNTSALAAHRVESEKLKNLHIREHMTLAFSGPELLCINYSSCMDTMKCRNCQILPRDGVPMRV